MIQFSKIVFLRIAFQPTIGRTGFSDKKNDRLGDERLLPEALGDRSVSPRSGLGFHKPGLSLEQGMGNGAKRTRTAGPLNAIEVLYQLSYSPTSFYYNDLSTSSLSSPREKFFFRLPPQGKGLEGKLALGAAFGPLLFFDDRSEDDIK